MIAEELAINRETEDLKVRMICAKMLHRNLMQQQQQQTEQRDMLADLLEKVESDPGLLNRVVTVGFINMIRRQNVNPWDIAHQIHQDQKKLACRNQNECLCVFFILKALFTESGLNKQ